MVTHWRYFVHFQDDSLAPEMRTEDGIKEEKTASSLNEGCNPFSQQHQACQEAVQDVAIKLEQKRQVLETSLSNKIQRKALPRELETTHKRNEIETERLERQPQVSASNLRRRKVLWLFVLEWVRVT